MYINKERKKERGKQTTDNAKQTEKVNPIKEKNMKKRNSRAVFSYYQDSNH